MTAPRYRYGDTYLKKLPWKQNFAINIGDCTFIDNSDTVTPPDQSSTLFPVKSVVSATWQTAITDPTVAPTQSAQASPLGPGFTVAGAGFKVAYTYVTKYGQESLASPLSTAMTTTGNGINVSLPSALPTGVIAVNWYVTATEGGNASTLRLAATTVGGYGVAISGPPASDAQQPPAVTQVSALALTQGLVARSFQGVSPQYYDGSAITSTTLPYGTKDGYLRIDAGGTYDFSCVSATFNMGDLVGMAKDTGNVLLAQSVVAVPLQAMAIGRVAMGGVSMTTVRVSIFGQENQVPRPSVLV